MGCFRINNPTYFYSPILKNFGQIVLLSEKKYRFGFNGKPNDDEVSGEGNTVDYGFRVSDTRIGRFFSIDPLFKSYPELTTYQFASNSPIVGIDIDGLELMPINSSVYRMKYTGMSMSVKVVNNKTVPTIPEPQYSTEVINKNVPESLQKTDLGFQVGVYGKDEPYLGPILTKEGNTIHPDLQKDENRDPTYTTKEYVKVVNKKTKTVKEGYVPTEKFNPRASVYGTKVSAISFILDVAVSIKDYNKNLDLLIMQENKKFYYQATLAVDFYSDKLEANLKAGQGRVDLINYIVDGTLPVLKANATKSEKKQYRAYSNKIKFISKPLIEKIKNVNKN